MKTSYDVIVVGASNAGGFAACAAAENGAKTLLIDSHANSANLFRHWLGSVNSKAQKEAGINIDQNKLIEFLSAFAQDNNDQSLLQKWVEKSGATIDWLDEKILSQHGDHIYVETDADTDTLINTAFPTEQHVTRDDKSSDLNWGKYVLDYAQKNGVDIAYNTKLEHLIKKNGRIVGTILRNTESNEIIEIAAKNVILCTGGYGANEALIEKWAPTLLKKCVYTQSPRDDGSGIVAGLEVGAQKDDEPASIIFDRGQVPVGTNVLDTYIKMWNVPQFVLASYPLLKVNLKGQRFFNESAPYQFSMNSLLHQPGNLEVVVWDENTLEHLADFHTLGCARLGWPGIADTALQKKIIESGIEAGTVHKADTIEALAKEMHLPVKEFTKTVQTYNQACGVGKDSQFGKEASKLISVSKGPFYAVTVGGNLLATLDGLKINTDMQVVDRNYDPIPGLYAAGNCSGGFFWGAYPDRIPGLTCGHAITFGRLAGINAAKSFVN